MGTKLVESKNPFYSWTSCLPEKITPEPENSHMYRSEEEDFISWFLLQ